MGYEKELALLKNHVKRIYKDVFSKGFDTSFKGVQDIVTSSDLEVESQLVALLKEAFPGDHFHTEESYASTELKPRTWVIDPIDGTSNYASHLNLYVIQIALYDQGDIVLSYVYFPGFDKTYTALKGHGAFINDQPYLVSSHQEQANFLVSMVGFTQKHSDKTYYQRLLKWSQSNQYKIRMLGSIGLEMCFTSEGIFDLFYSNVTNIWDIYPGILLLREAGAILVNEKGKPYRLNQDSHLFACKNRTVYDHFFRSIK